MVPPSQAGWVVDSGATSHMSSENGTVPPLIPLPSPVYVTVGNGAWVPVCFYSNMHLCLPSSNFVLKNVIRVPSLIQNLISVHQFTRDNAVSIEFDLFGFSVKDLRIRHVIIRCNSSGDLYTIPHTVIFGCLVAFATQTPPPPLPTNCLPGWSLVFSSATLHLTRVTTASIWLPKNL
jgi:hypothetical protein